MDLCVRAAVIFLITTVIADEIDFQCPTNENDSLYPHPESCKKYFMCENGAVKELTCPYSFYFDIDKQECISANNGRCPEVVEARHFKKPCQGKNGVEMVPHQSCSKYYLCLGNYPYEKPCDNNQLFDADSRKCTNPENARCQVDLWCPVGANSNLFFPDPENCARYAVCHSQRLYYQYCAEGLFFNVEKQLCTEPRFSNCKINGIHCTYMAKVSHPSKNTSYYECLDDYPHYRECPDNHHFNQAYARCFVVQ